MLLRRTNYSFLSALRYNFDAAAKIESGLGRAFTDANKVYLPRYYDGDWDVVKWGFALTAFKYSEQSANMKSGQGVP